MSGSSTALPSGRVWARVARTLLDRIDRGELKPGDRVPARAVLATQHQCSRLAVTRALTTLASDGVLAYCGSKGYVVPVGEDRQGQGDGDPRAWVRVAGALRDRIADGELKPWDLVPSIGVLCREFGCSRSPVTCALMTLGREGVIQRLPGIGYRVAGTHPAAAAETYPWEAVPRDPSRASQVARVLVEQIGRGELPVGHPVPAKAQLMRELGAGDHTVQRAWAILATRGIIARAYWQRQYRVQVTAAELAAAIASARSRRDTP